MSPAGWVVEDSRQLWVQVWVLLQLGTRNKLGAALPDHELQVRRSQWTMLCPSLPGCMWPGTRPEGLPTEAGVAAGHLCCT